MKEKAAAAKIKAAAFFVPLLCQTGKGTNPFFGRAGHPDSIVIQHFSCYNRKTWTAVFDAAAIDIAQESRENERKEQI